MQSTLFYIPHEFLGLPVFGFGLLLGIWVLFSVALMAWLVWRQGLVADTWAYVPLLLLLAALIGWLLPVLSQARGLPIRGFGLMNLVAVLSATGLAAWRARRVGLDPDMMVSLAFWLCVPGILGARAFYVIEYWPDQYGPVLQHEGRIAFLRELINLTEGGLVVYGSLIGASLGLWAFVRKYRLPLLAVADLIAPCMLLGLALGRLGCMLNGCCFGGVCELPWAVTFPGDSPAHYHQILHGHTSIHGLRMSADAQGRPEIAELEKDSPAWKQGLRPGQVISKINGEPIPSVGRATRELMRLNKMVFAVEGIPQGIAWPLQAGPVLDPTQRREVLEGRRFIHGLKIAGDRHDRPVIVEVEPGSPPSRYGLKPGQRVTVVDGRPVETVKEARWALLSANRISVATEKGRHMAQWHVEGPPQTDRPVRPIHPTQLYSAINALLLCLLLLAYDPFCKRDGQLFAVMLTIYPITRFLLEIIRTDESGVFGTELSISQNGSLLVLAGVAALWYYLRRHPAERTFA